VIIEIKIRINIIVDDNFTIVKYNEPPESVINIGDRKQISFFILLYLVGFDIFASYF